MKNVGQAVGAALRSCILPSARTVFLIKILGEGPAFTSFVKISDKIALRGTR